MRTVSAQAFPDRTQAGLELAKRLQQGSWSRPVVLGLARGGVVVGAAVARELDAPLDVVVARKIGAPGQPEFGIGATTAVAEPAYDDSSLTRLSLTSGDLAGAAAEQQAEAQRMLDLYQGARQPEARQNRDVIVVDDGLATGISATAALRAERAAHPRTLTLAAPVGSPDAADALRVEADEVICVRTPEPFHAVGQWYATFEQVTDDEVVEILENAQQRVRGA